MTDERLTLNVALIQWAAAGNDIAANLDLAERACREAKALAADIALFPECWSVGYASHHAFDDDRVDLWRNPELGPAGTPVAGGWDGLAIASDGPELQRMRALAAELDMAIVFTFLEEWPGGPRNSAALIDRHGEIALIYAKVHTCVFDLPEYELTPGDDFPVAEIDTSVGSVRIGVMICYDREFPESARLLMLNGAEIILVPNACDLEDNRLMQFRTRATENMIGAAMANYPGSGWGKSVAFDGIAFQQGSRDTTIVQAGEESGIIIAAFDLAALRDYRQRETWGNAFRRPKLYAKLAESTIQQPFIRENAKGERWEA